MRPADEPDELRALQARAYGRDGGLSAAEAARLHELVTRRGATSPAAARPRPDAPTGAAPHAAEPARAEGVGSAPGEPASSLRPHDVSPPAGRQRRLLVGVTVAALIVGVAVGVSIAVGLRPGAVPSATSAPIVLTPDQEEWQDDLSRDAGYDPGSLHAVSVQEDVVVWGATKHGGGATCMLIGNRDSAGASCRPTELVQQSGLSLTLTRVGEQKAGRITGEMLLSLRGDPAVSLRLFRYDTDIEGLATSYGSPDEERFAAALVGDGFRRSSVQIVGYDGDNPIWRAVRIDDGSRCLVYSVLPLQSWAQCTTDAEQDLTVERTDERTDLTTGVVWTETSGPGPQLTITTSESVDDGVRR